MFSNYFQFTEIEGSLTTLLDHLFAKQLLYYPRMNRLQFQVFDIQIENRIDLLLVIFHAEFFFNLNWFTKGSIHRCSAQERDRDLLHHPRPDTDAGRSDPVARSKEFGCTSLKIYRTVTNIKRGYIPQYSTPSLSPGWGLITASWCGQYTWFTFSYAASGCFNSELIVISHLTNDMMQKIQRYNLPVLSGAYIMQLTKVESRSESHHPMHIIAIASTTGGLTARWLYRFNHKDMNLLLRTLRRKHVKVMAISEFCYLCYI